MQESKEKISSRMIKNASRLWGFQETQTETSFDPVVGLLLGALASELAKVSGDINRVEARILEKLVELLTPESVTGPSPAHALVRAKPIDPVLEITPGYQFLLHKRFVQPGEHTAQQKAVFFTPAGKYKLFNGDLKYVVAGSKVFKYEEGLEKEIMAVGHSSKTLKPSELWLGLVMDEELESLEGLSVCFDLRNEVYEESFYESLSKGNWTINNHKVNFRQGMAVNSADPSSLEDLMQQEQEITTKVNNHINRFYKKKFFTLQAPKVHISTNDDKRIPDEIRQVFQGSDLSGLEENVIWIKVEFPQIMPLEVFDDLFCSINCFPAQNIHLNEFTQSSREFINIIPILTEEVFFAVKKVSSSDGKVYVQKLFSGIDDINEGSFIIRNGGIGRFDSRNAAEVLNYLLELLRDESAAFSVMGSDMIASDLKELNQAIARLEQRLAYSNVVKKEIPYLLLKSHPENDTLFIEFWTTGGAFGNKIKSGHNLSVYEGTGLWPESVMMVTNSVGGSEGMDTEERVYAYRKALLSHGRVVTKEDIKAFCYEHMGKLLEKVEVKKGLQTGQSTDSGFSQTHDIFLTLRKQLEEIDENELNYLKKDLLVKLEEQSLSVLPFRCFIIRN